MDGSYPTGDAAPWRQHQALRRYHARQDNGLPRATGKRSVRYAARNRRRGQGGITLHLPLDHHRLDLGDGFRRIEALWAGLGAVHDRVAAVEPERVLEIVEPLTGSFVARVDEPAAGLQQRSRPHEFVRVPPVARAGGRAAGAEDALVQP